jgi:HSP20 family protein
MASQDRSRQQSSFSPQSGAQQGGGGSAREEHGTRQQHQREEGRPLASRQGTWLGARDGGYAASPFTLMQRLTADMDRLFENFGMGMFSRGAWPFAGLTQGGLPGLAATWSPHIELFEQEGRLVVQAELPGLRKEEVDAQIEDDAIVISGERRNETQSNDGGRYLSERSYGSFYRVIPLPDGVDAEHASATFRDGVLRIEMPLNQRPRGKRLDIGDGTGSDQQRATSVRQGGSQQQQSES